MAFLKCLSNRLIEKELKMEFDNILRKTGFLHIHRLTQMCYIFHGENFLVRLCTFVVYAFWIIACFEGGWLHYSITSTPV